VLQHNLHRDDQLLLHNRTATVHDQYKHELTLLNCKVSRLTDKLQQQHSELQQAEHAVTKLQQQLEQQIRLSQQHVQESEGSWQSRLTSVEEHHKAVIDKLRTEAAVALTKADEKLARIEAECTLLKREHGKVTVAQRALERELSRTEQTLQNETRHMKDTLEAKLLARDKKLAVAKRERNALLTTLRELQKKQQFLAICSNSSSSAVEGAHAQHKQAGEQQYRASTTVTRGADTVTTATEALEAVAVNAASDGDDQSSSDQRDQRQAEHIAAVPQSSTTSALAAVADAVLARRIADMTAKTSHLLSLDSDSSDDDDE
jgi:chromosome segregation ATPase